MKTYFVYFQVQVDAEGEGAVAEKNAIRTARSCLAHHNDSICNAKITVTEYAEKPVIKKPKYKVK